MTTQKITIEPVTRIEGHAKVTIHMTEDGNVDHAYLHVNEFRGFEKFCEGRMVFEMPNITPRICGICPVSHHLAAAKAGDEVYGAPPPRPAALLRELMHMGQIIQSHGMHFFELAGPDLLLGFDADPAVRNVVGIIQANPELALKAVNLRKFGQEIIHILGGIFWVGSALLMNFFVGPTLRATGDAGRQFAGHFMARTRFVMTMNISVIATVLAGFWLYGIDSNWFQSSWMSFYEWR